MKKLSKTIYLFLKKCYNEVTIQRKEDVMTKKFEINESDLKEFMNRIAIHKKKPGPLMPVLHDAQNIFGCIPIEIQKIVSKELGISVGEINGVVTFYSRFSVEPKGKHIIGVCLGTACYVRGSQDIINTISTMLKIQPGQTTNDGNFTLEATRCVGACGLAPVVTIDGKVYGSCNSNIAKKAIEDILKAND